MKNQELLDRVLAEHAAEGLVTEPRRPSRALVAFIIRWARGLRVWKAQTLADFAGVSLATVERAERGEPVSDAFLDRLATTLGYEPGAFTAERIPLSPEEAQASLAEDWRHRVVVEVATLAKERQLRELSQCHAVLKLGRGHSEESAQTLDELAEWLDLISFIRNDDLVVPNEPKRLRKLYRDTFECIERLRGEGMTLVAGIWKDPKPGIPDFAIAVLAISPRALDPGALKRRIIVLDRRDMAGLKLSFGGDDGDAERPM